MTSLGLSAVFFLLIHLVIAGTRIRDVIVRTIGEVPYLLAFAVLSLVGLFWMARSYSAALIGGSTTVLWVPPIWLLHGGVLLVLIAAVLVVVGLTTRTPTSAGQEGLLAQHAGPTGITKITRHPFLWGVFLWAAFHLAVNGDTASLVFFGTFLILTLFGTFSIDAKRKRKYDALWDEYAEKSSNIPFAAVLQGRTSLGLSEVAWWQWLAAIGVFFAIVYLHPWLFGVPAIPGFPAYGG